MLSFKEFLSEAKTKIKDMSKDQISGEVLHFVPGINSGELSEYLSDIMAYLKSEYGDKYIDKSLATKISGKKL